MSSTESQLLTEEQAAKLIDELISPYQSRFNEVMERVFALVNLHQELVQQQLVVGVVKEKLGAAQSPSNPALDDVLRAAVILLHATLEDLMRTIPLRLLPWLPTSFLRKIDSRWPEKFFLCKLSEFRGKTVNEVIQDSVETYLATLTFNSMSDIVVFLHNMGIEIKDADECFKNIDELMKRRHQIAHRADRSGQSSGLASIASQDVLRWIRASVQLLGIVIKPAVLNEIVSQGPIPQFPQSE